MATGAPPLLLVAVLRFDLLALLAGCREDLIAEPLREELQIAGARQGVTNVLRVTAPS